MVSKLRSELNKYYIEDQNLRRMREQTEREAHNTRVLISKTEENILRLEKNLDVLKNHKKLLRKIGINSFLKGLLGSIGVTLFLTICCYISFLISAEFILTTLLGYATVLSAMFLPVIVSDITRYCYSKDSQDIKSIVESNSLKDIEFKLELEKRAKINLEREQNKINERLVNILKDLEVNRSIIDKYNSSIEDIENMLIDRVLGLSILSTETFDDQPEYGSVSRGL